MCLIYSSPPGADLRRRWAWSDAHQTQRPSPARYARNAIFHHGRLDKGVQLITKPFSLSDLAVKIRDVLDGLSRTTEGR
jgi:hypothetical protein